MESKPTSRSRRPRLDRALIVEAAIARVEQHGLEELSARKLAQDLGCEAMSLYHHVPSMEALKDAMVDELLASIAASAASRPTDALAEEATAYLSLAQTHPGTFKLIATRRWKGERARAAAARVIDRFVALGFESRKALARARTLGAYLNGAGLALAAWACDPDAAAKDGRQVKADLIWGLSAFVRRLSD